MNLNGKLELVNLSDVGRKRPHNEDSTASDLSIGFAVIADGMGGYKAGEVASAIAVTTIMNEVRTGLQGLPPAQVDEASGYTRESLIVRQAVVHANSRIFRTAQTEPLCQGMGTTVVSILFYDDRMTVAHVGDSRMYRLRGEQFEQITSDHSLIQELVDRGFFTRAEAEASTPKNLVTRALGIDEDVEVDIREHEVAPGDIYLLCSDGLNDMVNDEEIHLTLSKYSANLVQAGTELIRLANERGGNDNISVILARPLQHFKARNGWYTKILGKFS